MVHVIVHNSVTANGRVDGFDADIGLHYGLASSFGADVHLAGSDTILAAGMDADDDMDGGLGPPRDDPHDARPLLVVVDSRGRVDCWQALRRASHWRERMVALCSRATPTEYLDRLAARHVDHVIAGDRHVDLQDALAALARIYDANRVLVDSGGTLNAALLRAGLVDEVSLLVHPWLVDGPRQASMFLGRRSRSGACFAEPGSAKFRSGEPMDAVALRLMAVDRPAGDMVWLRYEVVGSDTAAS